MALETIHSTHYIGRILPDGHLEIPHPVLEKIGLRRGDKVAIAIRKVRSSHGEAPPSDKVRSLIAELVGGTASPDEAVEALTVLATAMMPPEKQRRLSQLLWKNHDGTICAEEEQELNALVEEGQRGTVRKAKAILALQHLGIDILPDLEASLRET